MEDSEYHREIQKRERTFQLFLLVASLLVATTQDGIHQAHLSFFFVPILFLGLIYYVLLTRTKHDIFTALFAGMFSGSYSFFLEEFGQIVIFGRVGIITLSVFYLIFASFLTYSLLPISASKYLDDVLGNFYNKNISSHPFYEIIFCFIVFVLIALIVVYFLIFLYASSPEAMGSS